MKKKRGSGDDELGYCVDIKSLIDQHSGFFDKLVELIPAKFYLPVDDDKDKVWYPGLSKEEKALAKKESKENIRKARRDRLDPEKSSASTLDLLMQNLEKENLSSESDEEEVEINPKMTGGMEEDGDNESVTYEELRERLRLKIEELRAGRNADGLDRPRKVRDKNDRRKIHEKKRKRECVSDSGAASVNVAKDIAEAAKELEFSHVKLGNDGEQPGKGKKKRKISKLKELEKAKELAAAKKDPEIGDAISQKHSWQAAMSRAAGVKVHDNPKLIERSLKKEKKRQQKNAEKWKDRVDTQQKSKAEKQQKRSQNIQGRIQEKKMRKIAKREKKLMRPGFEGRKKGYINSTST